MPVILGIWGPNGNGKTFQTQLVYKLLGIDAKTITAEQLFASDGARAANLILDSYFAASDAISQVCCFLCVWLPMCIRRQIPRHWVCLLRAFM